MHGATMKIFKIQFNIILPSISVLSEQFFFPVFLTERLHLFPSCPMHGTWYTMILISALVHKFLQPQYEAVKI